MTTVIGAPGVGKSKIFMDGITSYLSEYFENEQNTSNVKIAKINGLSQFEGFTSINGYSLKTNSRSSLGTYLEILPEFRKYYAGLPASKARPWIKVIFLQIQLKVDVRLVREEASSKLI